jgi:hypothetical protein
MGARPEQQLALNFLAAVHDLWIQHPGTYSVEESIDDLVPALAQMCIKALASDLRDDDSTKQEQEMHIDGVLVDDDRVIRGGNGRPSLTLHVALNKIIHGTPTSVEVGGDDVRLHFSNSSAGENWTEVWFSGTQLLKLLDRVLHKHRGERTEEREQEIQRLLTTVGIGRFLPDPQ